MADMEGQINPTQTIASLFKRLYEESRSGVLLIRSGGLIQSYWQNGELRGVLAGRSKGREGLEKLLAVKSGEFKFTNNWAFPEEPSDLPPTEDVLRQLGFGRVTKLTPENVASPPPSTTTPRTTTGNLTPRPIVNEPPSRPVVPEESTPVAVRPPVTHEHEQPKSSGGLGGIRGFLGGRRTPTDWMTIIPFLTDDARFEISAGLIPEGDEGILIRKIDGWRTFGQIMEMTGLSRHRMAMSCANLIRRNKCGIPKPADFWSSVDNDLNAAE